MRSVSTAVRLLGLLVVLAMVVPATYADEEARISPPGGFTSQARIHPPGGFTSQARINPPGGFTSQARINPPVGVASPEPSVFALLVEWLRAQARIHIPLG